MANSIISQISNRTFLQASVFAGIIFFLLILFALINYFAGTDMKFFKIDKEGFKENRKNSKYKRFFN